MLDLLDVIAVELSMSYLQLMQWHTTLYIGSPSTWNWIAPHKHRPTELSSMLDCSSEGKSGVRVWLNLVTQVEPYLAILICTLSTTITVASSHSGIYSHSDSIFCSCISALDRMLAEAVGHFCRELQLLGFRCYHGAVSCSLLASKSVVQSFIHGLKSFGCWPNKL